jgi:hypothetical protein
MTMNTAAASPLKGTRINFWPFAIIWRERITPPDGQKNARRYLYGISLWGGSTAIAFVRTVEQ